MEENKVYDSLIIGGGPAGLTAAIYLARAGRSTVVLEAGVPGGQMFISHLIENYPGFPEPVSGAELSDRMKKQVENLGVSIEMLPIDKVYKEDDNYVVEGFGKQYKGKTLVIATGTKSRMLGVKGESDFFGRGVSYCSTCDGMFFKGKKAFVIGGGNSAFEAVEYLSKICSHVTLAHRRKGFRAEQVVVDRVKTIENVDIITDVTVEEIKGEQTVNKIVLKNKITEEITEYDTDAVFIYVGSIPQTEFLGDFVNLADSGHIIADSEMKTNLAGVYAVGDVIVKQHRQIATAVSDACIAALNIDAYLSAKGE